MVYLLTKQNINFDCQQVVMFKHTNMHSVIFKPPRGLGCDGVFSSLLLVSATNTLYI